MTLQPITMRMTFVGHYRRGKVLASEVLLDSDRKRQRKMTLTMRMMMKLKKVVMNAR